VRVLCSEEGTGGSESCKKGCPGRSGEEMGGGVGVKGAVFIPDGVVGVRSDSCW
jgi:hypothetical protein